jgi:hypothetical protein
MKKKLLALAVFASVSLSPNASFAWHSFEWEMPAAYDATTRTTFFSGIRNFAGHVFGPETTMILIAAAFAYYQRGPLIAYGAQLLGRP